EGRKRPSILITCLTVAVLRQYHRDWTLDFRDAVVVDERANRFEQIVAFRSELGGLAVDRPPMGSDLPQGQGRVLDREGGAGPGQGLEILAVARAPVLPGGGAAGDAVREDILEVGRALGLVEECPQKEMGADGVVADLKQTSFGRLGAGVGRGCVPAFAMPSGAF